MSLLQQRQQQAHADRMIRNEYQDIRRTRSTAMRGYRQAKKQGRFDMALDFLDKAKTMTGATSNSFRQEADMNHARGLAREGADMRSILEKSQGAVKNSGLRGGGRLDGSPSSIGSSTNSAFKKTDENPSLVDDAKSRRVGLSAHENNPMAEHLFGFSDGGKVPGLGDEDTIPSMLTPGEVVLTEQQQALVDNGMPIDQALSQTGAGNGLPPEEDGLVAESSGRTRMLGAGARVDLSAAEKMRIDAGLNADGSTNETQPLPQAAPGQSNKQLMDEAVRAGYTPSDKGVAAYQSSLMTDASVRPPSLEQQQAAQAGLQESMGLGADSTPAYSGPKRPDPNSARGMDERRAQAAIAPGAQRQTAIDADNARLEASGQRVPEQTTKNEDGTTTVTPAYNKTPMRTQRAAMEARWDMERAAEQGDDYATMDHLKGLPRDVFDKASMTENLTVKQANDLRKKHGLKPIPYRESASDIFTRGSKNR